MQPHQGRGLWILIIDHELDKSEPAQVFCGGSWKFDGCFSCFAPLLRLKCFHRTCEEGQVGLSL